MRQKLGTLGLALICIAMPVFGASIVTVDESGNGNINGVAISYQLAQDPGPGGLPNTLTYNLPFTGTSGDVELIEPESGIPGDVIRFNGNGTLIFYSMGTAPNTPELADQPRPPFPVPNTVQINETANSDAFYTPTAGQPGYDGTATPTYHFISNAPLAVPEPASLALLLIGGFGAVAATRNRRKPA